MPTARLIIQQPGQRSRVAEVAAPVVSVGRRPDNTVCLEDSGVSKYHAVIEQRGEQYIITDLGSSNGTTVNDEPLVAQRPLRDGDLICIGGNSTLEFHLEAETDGAPGGAGLPSAPSVGMPSAPGLNPPSVPNVNMPNVNMPSVNMPHAPHVQMPSAPHMPSVQTPHVPSIQTPSVPSVQTPSIVHKVLNLPRALVAGVSATLLGGVILATLWGAGVVGGSSSKPAHAADDLTADPLAQLDAAAEPAKDEGKSEAAPASQEQPAPPTTADAAPPAPPAGVAVTANADVTGALARALAGQISQKSGYTFDPRFVEQIKTYTNDYKTAANYYERAGKYRDPIEREFSNTQGMHPLVPYLLAMSQTKFVERPPSGVWNLPPALLAQYAGSADTSDPAVATRAAAAYTRALFDTFEQEDFMYAVACYGMSVDDAGAVSTALAQKDPDRRLRGDFWKMKAAGVVQGAQVERVARFFAAGIVFENPSQFGLKGEPLSTLY